MKTTTTLLILFTLFSFSAFAQDYRQWGLPEGAKARIGKGEINEIAYSPDGTRLAIASYIGIWIYDMETYQEVALLAGHSLVNGVSFSPDGNTIATASDDEAVRLWDVSTGTLIRTFTGHTSYVTSVSFNPDGRTIASGSEDGTVRLWSVNTGTQIHTFTLPNRTSSYTDNMDPTPVYSVAFSPNGKRLAAADLDGKIRLWQVWMDDRRLEHTFEGHSSMVNSIAFGNSITLATASNDHTIRLWDCFRGSNTNTLAGHKTGAAGDSTSVDSIAFSPDGRILASGSRYDPIVRLWDVGSVDPGTQIQTFTGHTHGVRSVSFSPDGNTLATASGDQTVRLWDVNSGKLIRTLTGPYSVNSVFFSPNGSTLATFDSDKVLLWDVNIVKLIRTFPLDRREGIGFFEGSLLFEDVVSVFFSPDGNTLATLATASDDDGTVRLWDPVTGEQKQTLTGHTRGVSSVAFSPDGATLASVSGQTVRLWDPVTGEQKQTLTGHTRGVSSVAFSPDGATLASGSEDKTVRLWDAHTGAHLHTLIEHTLRVDSVSFSSNGNTIASLSGQTVRLWDVSTGTLIRTFTPNHPPFGVDSVSFSPNGNTLATFGNDTVRLWDAMTGEHTRALTGHTSVIDSVSFSPDGNTLATASWDGTVLLWALTQDSKELPPPPPDWLEGFMTTKESIRWLKAQGYTVEKNDNVYTIKRERVTDSEGIIIRDDVFVGEIGLGALIGIGEGIFITTDSGGIRVKVSDTQQ